MTEQTFYKIYIAIPNRNSEKNDITIRTLLRSFINKIISKKKKRGI